MAENRWRELCEAIMKEQDPQRLSDLVRELNVALDERELELQQGRLSMTGTMTGTTTGTATEPASTQTRTSGGEG